MSLNHEKYTDESSEMIKINDVLFEKVSTSIFSACRTVTCEHENSLFVYDSVKFAKMKNIKHPKT